MNIFILLIKRLVYFFFGFIYGGDYLYNCLVLIILFRWLLFVGYVEVNLLMEVGF